VSAPTRRRRNQRSQRLNANIVNPHKADGPKELSPEIQSDNFYPVSFIYYGVAVLSLVNKSSIYFNDKIVSNRLFHEIEKLLNRCARTNHEFEAVCDDPYFLHSSSCRQGKVAANVSAFIFKPTGERLLNSSDSEVSSRFERPEKAIRRSVDPSRR
jgi:hypothetical protein